MNYQKIYNDLVSKAKNRNLSKDVYKEVHHIIPRCLGGNNSSENLVELTAEEHFVAHQLLVKLNPGHKGTVFGAMRMTTHNKTLGRVNNKLYGWLRKELSKSQKGKSPSLETREKLSKALKGKKKNLTPEGLEKIRLAAKNRIISEEECEKKRIASTGRFHSEETKQKIAASKIGKPRSPETIEKLRVANLGKKRGPISKEAREKISKGNTGKIRSEEMKRHLSELNKGHIHSDESKKKMSDSRKGVKKSSEHARKVEESRQRGIQLKHEKLWECGLLEKNIRVGVQQLSKLWKEKLRPYPE